MKQIKVTPWTDKPVFDIMDVARLTGLTEATLHAMVHRGQWEPLLPIPIGKPPSGSDARYYTARDVLRAMLVAAAIASNSHVPYGDSAGRQEDTINALVLALDRSVAEYVDGTRVLQTRKTIIPKLRHPWCYTVFDIKRLVSYHAKKLKGAAWVVDQARRKAAHAKPKTAGAATP